MGVITEKWNIAFRDAAGYRNTDAPYTALPADREGWYADPFLFEKDGEMYLFAEFFSYKTRKGSIVVFTYDRASRAFSDRREALGERFHLSYPQVFARENSIFMLPETSEAEALILYRAVGFPDRWKEEKVLCAGARLVDTTLIPSGGAAAQKLSAEGAPEAFVYLYRDGVGAACRTMNPAGRGLDRIRPGGAFFTEDGVTVATAQDCTETYGGALEFYDYQTGETIFRLSPQNVSICGESGRILGVHTYNRCGGIEVIDYKTETVSLTRIARRAVSILKGN